MTRTFRILVRSLAITSISFATLCLSPIALAQSSPTPCSLISVKYMKLCGNCHGVNGDGNGIESRRLPETFKPRDFTTGKFKAANCDTSLKDVFVNGGAQYGLNALMHSNPYDPYAAPDDLNQLNDEDLRKLIETIRCFRYGPQQP